MAAPAAADEAAVADGSAGVEQRYIKAELGEMNEIESMCPKCQENGTTRLMITNIPHFREIIVSSFSCPHCGEENRAVEFGGAYGPKRVKYHLEVKPGTRDMNRQIIKGDFGTLTIPELELELGPDAQRGSLNTVEGVLQQVRDGLEFQQPVRRIQDPEMHDKIEAFIRRLDEYKSGEKPFNMWLEDPAGNSYIESIYEEGTNVDHRLTLFEITRSTEERRQIGLATDDAYNPTREADDEAAVERGAADEITEFVQPCPACGTQGSVKVKETHIPFFGRIIIMAFKCDACGFKTNEVKNAGDVPDKGRRITLRVENESDLCRDVLKSETTRLEIPEIGLEMAPGTLGGFFTTVEGVLAQVHEQLGNMRQASFEGGDSEHLHTSTSGGTMHGFLASLDELRSGSKPFTLVFEDPCGMVYVQNPRSHLKPPENEDPQLTVEDYERTDEEKEELGLD